MFCFVVSIIVFVVSSSTSEFERASHNFAKSLGNGINNNYFEKWQNVGTKHNSTNSFPHNIFH